MVSAAFLALLATSWAYPVLVNAFDDGTVTSLKAYVPTTPMQVVFWAAVGAALHAGALLIALKMKRAFARARVERPESHPPENVIIALVIYATGVVALLILGLVQGRASAGPFFWALLPATTGYFVGKYVDKAMEGRPYSFRRALRQAAVMSGMGTATALIYLPEHLDFLNLPKVVWYFAAYSAVATGLVGLVIGVLFHKLYSHKDATRRIELSPDLRQPETRTVIGDLIVETLAPRDPATSIGANVVALHNPGEPRSPAGRGEVTQPRPGIGHDALPQPQAG